MIRQTWIMVVTLSVIVGGWCIGVNAEQEPAATSAPPAAPAIQNNMDVGMEYTLTSDGVVVDSTKGKDSFHYVHGQGQIIPGLERQLLGMQVGESKEITVTPEEGYGKVDPAGFVEIPKEQLPKDVTPSAGMVLRGVNPDGRNFQAMIDQVKEKTVVLNLNHPLAGKTLNFKVKITDLKPAMPAPASMPTSAPAVSN